MSLCRVSLGVYGGVGVVCLGVCWCGFLLGLLVWFVGVVGVVCFGVLVRFVLGCVEGLVYFAQVFVEFV